jgi:hypothetical protein
MITSYERFDIIHIMKMNRFSLIDSDTAQNNSVYRGTYLPVSVNSSGFDAATAQGMIFGGWCDAWNKCPVPNDVIMNKSSTYMVVPMTLNSPGTYTLYIFNSASGKTSNGKPIYIQ